MEVRLTSDLGTRDRRLIANVIQYDLTVDVTDGIEPRDLVLRFVQIYAFH